MIPIRLTLLLIGIILLILLVLGNPHVVTLNLLFWSPQIRLYKIIIGTVFLGVILAIIFTGHAKYLKRIRLDRFR